MKSSKFQRLGGATLAVTLVTASILVGHQIAVADEIANRSDAPVLIVDGPGLLEPPLPQLPPPPREDSPSGQPTPSPAETPIYNTDPEPTIPPVQAPREEPSRGSEEPQQQTSQPTVPEVSQTTELTSKPTVEAPAVDIPKVETPAVASKPVSISAPLTIVSAPMPTGRTTITPAARTSLAKTASEVKTFSKPVSIAVTTTGTTVSKATAQANAIVAELKKSGVSAVTVIKRVGKKTSVSVLVTKKKP